MHILCGAQRISFTLKQESGEAANHSCLSKMALIPKHGLLFLADIQIQLRKLNCFYYSNDVLFSLS